MAGISKISVLSFGTMGEEVSMVHWLWHIYFGSILSKSWATAIFVFYSIYKGILGHFWFGHFGAILLRRKLIFQHNIYLQIHYKELRTDLIFWKKCHITFSKTWFSHFCNFDHGSQAQMGKFLYPQNPHVLGYILYGFSVLAGQLWRTFFMKNIAKICL